MTDPERFHFVTKVTKLRGSHAVRLTYANGFTETVSAEYLVRTAERIGHRQAGEFRRRLLASRARPPVRHFERDPTRGPRS